MENRNLITKAIEFIQANPKGNLSLQSIADNAGFSLTYFDALFKKHTGYTPVEYSRIYKLTRSAIFLRKSEKTILDIALDFGYANHESFTRAFKSFYGITPGEYRKKYTGVPLAVRDYSGKVALNRFKNALPKLKIVDLDDSIDYLFTHNALKYGEDIVGLTVTDTEVFTLGETEKLEHFLYVADYNSPIASVCIVCGKESEAIEYLDMLYESEVNSFCVHINPDEEWNELKAKAEKIGMSCDTSFDMLYLEDTVVIPYYQNMSVRELSKDDMPLVRAFRQKGGCGDCHVRGLQAHFDNKGNATECAFGTFCDNELICLATPVLDNVRNMKKYDIGALFTIEHSKAREATEMMWRFIIDFCIKNGAILGNANADGCGSLSISESEKAGLTKVAKILRFSKS